MMNKHRSKEDLISELIRLPEQNQKLQARHDRYRYTGETVEPLNKAVISGQDITGFELNLDKKCETELELLTLELEKYKNELERIVEERRAELQLANVNLERAHQKIHDILESISDAFYAVDSTAPPANVFRFILRPSHPTCLSG